MLSAVSTMRLETWRATCKGVISTTSFLTFVRPKDCNVAGPLLAFFDRMGFCSFRTASIASSFVGRACLRPAAAAAFFLGAMGG